MNDPFILLEVIKELHPKRGFAIVNGEVEFDDGTIVNSSTFDLELQKKKEEKLWTAFREKRDQLLSASDWLIISSIEMKKEVDPNIIKYRQELRDLPSAIGQINEKVDWPVMSKKKS